MEGGPSRRLSKWPSVIDDGPLLLFFSHDVQKGYISERLGKIISTGAWCTKGGMIPPKAVDYTQIIADRAEPLSQL